MITAEILDGNIERYAELIDKYEKQIYSTVARRVPPQDVAQVAHDVFLQAYRSLAQYSTRVSFGNWATGIAIRRCCAYWREQYRHRPRQLELDEKTMRKLTCPSSEAARNSQDDASVVNYVLKQLPPEDRTLIESVYFDGMPLKEVAAALGWSLVKTKVKAFRARRKMREHLMKMTEEL